MHDIDAIIKEMNRIKRNKAQGLRIGDGQSNVEAMMDQLMDQHNVRMEHKSKPFRKSRDQSPTKRLIDMKNTTTKSKQLLVRADPQRFHPHSSTREY